MLFDMISCKAWKLCNIFAQKHFIDNICITNLMLFAQTGSKSFKNNQMLKCIGHSKMKHLSYTIFIKTLHYNVKKHKDKKPLIFFKTPYSM